MSFSSTLDTVHKPPVVTAGANVTYHRRQRSGARRQHADRTISQFDQERRGVRITGGFPRRSTRSTSTTARNRDLPTDGTTSAISASFNTASGVLTLTALGGSASFTDFQTALDHVRFSHTGDPTGGGEPTPPARSPGRWSTPTAANNTGSSTSTLNTVHLPPSLSGTNGVTATYTEGQATTTFLDSGFTAQQRHLDERHRGGERVPERRCPARRQSRWAYAHEQCQWNNRAQRQRHEPAISNRAASISFSEVAGSDPTHGRQRGPRRRAA